MGIRMPRLVIAALSGNSGKTIVSLSLLSALRRRGLSISVFKKGPDYIDSAWLSMAARTACRNLDTYMVSPDDVFNTFSADAAKSDIAIVEGNRGIFDGRDVSGTHSTARLAKLLQAPVVLVVNVARATRTMAAMINGCISFDPEIRIAGIILNRVAGKRHESIIADSIEKYCSLPVLGAVPNLEDDSSLIPARHLGLVTPSELNPGSDLETRLEEIADEHLDIGSLIKIANSAPPLHSPKKHHLSEIQPEVRIGYFKDSVFTFYYPENLEALRAGGADLIPISSLHEKSLPDIKALYIGGGFPETHVEQLAQNRSMMESVKKAADGGMPIYAECGGLIYLSKSLAYNDSRYPMAGIFPIDLKMHTRPVGHGYTFSRVDRDNPFFEIGLEIKGHEFHYSDLTTNPHNEKTCMRVESGVGLGNCRDGLLYNNTLACYVHIHADGVKDWAPSMVSLARGYSSMHIKNGKIDSEDQGPDSYRGVGNKAVMK